MNRTRQIIFLSVLLASAISGSGCGSADDPRIVTPQSSACPSGAAQIQIADGFARIQCGCVQPQGTRSSAAAPLVCTVATGTVVFFNFHSTLLRHQILSIPSPQFASSALIEPASLTPVHAVRFPDAGTYQYRDAFDPGIVGSIIVQ